MEQTKTINLTLPPLLLTELERAAQADRLTVEKFVEYAVQRSLESRRLQGLYAYAEERARTLGIREEDIDQIIHDHRQEEQDRQSAERGH